MAAQVAAQRFATVKVTEVQPHPRNPRKGDTEVITDSIEENGFYGALVVQEGTGNILVGSHRWQSARMAGIEELPALLLDVDEERARKIMLADNRTSDMAKWDEAGLVDLLREMVPNPRGLAGSGFTEAALMKLVTELSRRTEPGPTLSDQFLVAPFDVLDGRAGWWQQRRRAWLALGLKSELGRFGGAEGSRAAYAGGPGWARAHAQHHGTRRMQREVLGRKLTGEEIMADTARDSEVSIFDPVLCELAVRWFSPEGGQVLDPFAGGSVRGLVSALLGRDYHGNDLSARQVTANVEQAAQLLPLAADAGRAQWSTGDSLAWAPQLEPESGDLLFTCPPYYDTEVYTEHERDLSTMSAEEFESAYGAILAATSAALRPDRFAVVVCGDSRDKRTGLLRDMRGATIRAMLGAGLGYCSGAVQVMPAWSLAATAARYFRGRRTLGRIHEDVLVFAKGSASKAAKACGTVQVAFPETTSGAPPGNGSSAAVAGEG